MPTAKTTFDFEKWLDTECDPSEIRYLDTATKEGAYIPIGIIETKLDKFDEWGTEDFRFNIYKAGNFWLASGTVRLYVVYDKKRRTMNGSVTFTINSRESNLDFEATALSFCISNAVKKFGKMFGRHLNGRLDKGETAIPIVQTRDTIIPDQNIDIEFEAIRDVLGKTQYREDAQEYLNTTSFKHEIRAKQIVNSKPNKP